MRFLTSLTACLLQNLLALVAVGSDRAWMGPSEAFKQPWKNLRVEVPGSHYTAETMVKLTNKYSEPANNG